MKKIVIFTTLLILLVPAVQSYGQANSNDSLKKDVTDLKNWKKQVQEAAARRQRERLKGKGATQQATSVQVKADTARTYYQSPVGNNNMVFYGNNVTVNQNTKQYITKDGDTTTVADPLHVQVTNETPVFQLIWPTKAFLQFHSESQSWQGSVPDFVYTDYPYWKGWEWWKIWKMFSNNPRLRHKTCSTPLGFAESDHLMYLINHNQSGKMLCDSTPNIINMNGGMSCIRIEAKNDSIFHKKYWVFDFIDGASATSSDKPGEKIRLLFTAWKKKNKHEA